MSDEKFTGVNRVGLYIMVFLILIGTCDVAEKVDTNRIVREIKELKIEVQALRSELEHKGERQ